MLVLTRKSGESVFIDGKTKVFVMDAKNGSVKLGIEAPDHVLIYRGEVYEKIMEENRQAAEANIEDLSGLSGLLAFKSGKKVLKAPEKKTPPETSAA